MCTYPKLPSRIAASTLTGLLQPRQRLTLTPLTNTYVLCDRAWSNGQLSRVNLPCAPNGCIGALSRLARMIHPLTQIGHPCLLGLSSMWYENDINWCSLRELMQAFALLQADNCNLDSIYQSCQPWSLGTSAWMAHPSLTILSSSHFPEILSQNCRRIGGETWTFGVQEIKHARNNRCIKHYR